MQENAGNERPKLTLLKRNISISPRPEFELDFERDDDFGLELESTSERLNFLEGINSAQGLTFSDLFNTQKKTLERIKYYSDELEFNLE